MSWVKNSVSTMAKTDPIFDANVDQDAPPTPDVERVPVDTTAYRLLRVANGPQRSVGVAYLLFCISFVGLAGIQHFYLGHMFRGVLWLFTWGLGGIGLIYDLFATGSQVYSFNVRRSDVIAEPVS
jgi:TM2 domain-containing membrane protein YozV